MGLHHIKRSFVQITRGLPPLSECILSFNFKNDKLEAPVFKKWVYDFVKMIISL